MAVSWGIKAPAEVRTYSYNWTGRLNGAVITSATLVVTSGSVVLSNVANTDTAISCAVSGGIEGEAATILSTVVTDAGETLEQVIALLIEPSLWANIGPSTATKRQIIEMAYEECSLSGYEFDVSPDEIFTGLRKLDALMAEWRASGKDLNYNAPAVFGEGDLEDYAGIPDAAISGTSISLAMAIAPQMGKSMKAESAKRLALGMQVIRAMCARMRDMGWARSTVAGAGNRTWYGGNPFMLTRGW